jgi:DNA-directed RNA polymerase specialized sigma24 family protein
MEQATRTEALFLAWRTNSDLRALAQVFDETAPELYAVARHLARGTSEAEDLVQACFLAAIERAASYEADRPLRPRLCGILGNEARKLRSRRATIALPAKTRVQLALVARELGWVWRADESFFGASGETLERKLDVALVKHTLRCLDAATKAPLANQEIRWGAQLAGLEAQAHAQTDANGLLELALPEGRHEFLAGTAAQGAGIDWRPGGSDPLEILLPPAR